MSKRRGLSRRTLLRGTLLGGASIAVGLPLLDSMLRLDGAALADGSPLPQRFALWFWGNGSDPRNFAPAEVGAGWTPSPMLAGLAEVKDYVNVVSGTSLPVRGTNNPHVEGAVGMLVGGNPLVDPSYAGESNDWDFMTVPGPSIDEVAAEGLGPTPFRSLVVGVSPLHGVRGPGTAVRYTSHRDAYLFNPPEFDPRALFDLLFAGGVPTLAGSGPTAEELAKASVLDAVLEDASSLRSRLGASDQTRLSHHMEAIRELEVRLRSTDTSVVGASCAVPSLPTNPDSFRQRAREMADLVAMAFACDLTRVASIEFSSPASHTSYPDIFSDALIYNGSPTSFHEYEHNVGIDGTVSSGLRYFIENFGAFLEALRAVPEAEGNLLDHACVLGTSEVSDGSNHGFADYPTLVAGRANGMLKYPGVHVALPGANSARVPLTCLRALCLPHAEWGSDQFHTTEPVSELLTG